MQFYPAWDSVPILNDTKVLIGIFIKWNLERNLKLVFLLVFLI